MLSLNLLLCSQACNLVVGLCRGTIVCWYFASFRDLQVNLFLLLKKSLFAYYMNSFRFIKQTYSSHRHNIPGLHVSFRVVSSWKKVSFDRNNNPIVYVTVVFK